MLPPAPSDRPGTPPSLASTRPQQQASADSAVPSRSRLRWALVPLIVLAMAYPHNETLVVGVAAASTLALLASGRAHFGSAIGWAALFFAWVAIRMATQDEVTLADMIPTTAYFAFFAISFLIVAGAVCERFAYGAVAVTGGALAVLYLLFARVNEAAAAYSQAMGEAYTRRSLPWLDINYSSISITLGLAAVLALARTSSRPFGSRRRAVIAALSSLCSPFIRRALEPPTLRFSCWRFCRLSS